MNEIMNYILWEIYKIEGIISVKTNNGTFDKITHPAIMNLYLFQHKYNYDINELGFRFSLDGIEYKIVPYLNTINLYAAGCLIWHFNLNEKI